MKKILCFLTVLAMFVPGIAAAVCVVETPPGDATGPYQPCDGNLIVNGDFEQTDGALLGFTSEYRPYLERAPGDADFTIPGECLQATSCSNDNMWCEGVWVIGQNPANYHKLWWNTSLNTDDLYGVGNFGDHTTNRGNMLIINGSTALNSDGSSKVVWRQTVTGILPNTPYTFSFWARSAYTVAPPAFTVKAIVAGEDPVVLSADAFVPVAGVWQQRTYQWESGTAAEVTFEISNSTLASSGNDYALDDIELCLPVCALTDLIAGQHLDVGSVQVWNDDTGLRVTYWVEEPWCFTELHLAVGMYESDIPQTKKGSPIPGRFEYSYPPKGVEVCENVYTFPPLDMDPIEATCPMVIAAHAVVQMKNGCDQSCVAIADPETGVCSVEACQSWRTETGWGYGERFNTNDWSMYFNASGCYNDCPY